VLVMSVNPGFGGQHFIENTYKKVAEVKKLADEIKPNLFIEVDGGVDKNNAGRLFSAGANVLVAGSAVFAAPDPTVMISILKNA
jgi:ribulose-phosphate 3-epimerase